MQLYEQQKDSQKKKESDIINIMAITTFIVVLPILIFLLAVVNSFVLSLLWGWYIVPFFGAKPLPLAIAFGMSIIIEYLTSNLYSNIDNNKSFKDKIIFKLSFIISTILLGWVGTFFI